MLTSRDKKKERKKRKFECEKRKIKSDRQKGSEFFDFFPQFKSTTHTLAKIHCGPDWKNWELISVADVLLTTVIRGPKETQKDPWRTQKGQVVERTRVRHFNARSGRGKRKKGGRWSTMEF